MELKTIPVGGYQANCYSLREGDDLLFIDPGDEAEKLLAYLEKTEKKPNYIMMTHGHFDHVGAVVALKEAYPDCQVYIHQGDGKDADPSMFPLGDKVPDLKYFADGDQIPFGKGHVEIIGTPGHSKGSVCLKYDCTLFTGDTLFFGSMGRTDFIGGSYDEIMTSLAKLAKLPPETKIYPGHGDSSTIGQENAINPYVKEALRL